MNIVGHGIDLVDCSRIQDAIGKHGDRFLKRVYTESELEYCQGRKREIEHLAGRFAAKEAVLKVLGTGWRNGIAWTDVEVVNEGSGKPRVILRGRCREIADQQGMASILVSISHTETTAIASAVASRESTGGALGIGD